MKHLFIAIFSIILSPYLSQAQVIDYARPTMEKLSSDEFKGRGYIDDGDKMAAEFIISEFKKFGLKPYSENFTQSFNVSVNTFSDELTLKVNGRLLVPGKDYLIRPGSPTLKGDYRAISIEAKQMLTDRDLMSVLQKARGEVIVVQPYNKKDFSAQQNERINHVIGFLQYAENNPAAGTIILSSDKLTWGLSSEQHPKATFTVNASTINGPIEEVEVEVKNKFHKEYKTQNILGYIEGERSDSTIVFTAHYDHIGMMGKKAIFNGANDNASGTTMLLSLARHYSENKPPYNMAFIAFGAEELGLLGSIYFTENPLFDLSTIKFLVNFDLAGTGDDGIQVVNGSVYQREFDLLSSINEEQQLLPQVKIRGESCNSDHCMFHRKGVRSFFIYTLGGIAAYHDIYDRPETLPLTEFEDYFTLITEFVKRL